MDSFSLESCKHIFAKKDTEKNTPSIPKKEAFLEKTFWKTVQKQSILQETQAGVYAYGQLYRAFFTSLTDEKEAIQHKTTYTLKIFEALVNCL